MGRDVHDVVREELVVFLDHSSGERITAEVTRVHYQSGEDTQRTHNYNSNEKVNYGPETNFKVGDFVLLLLTIWICGKSTLKGISGHNFGEWPFHRSSGHKYR